MFSRGECLPSGKRFELDGREHRRVKVIPGTRAFAEEEHGSISIGQFESELRGNCTNPFGRETTIEYVLKNEQEVSVTVYNVLGQRVRTLVEDSQRAGIHTVRWKGENRYGDPVESAVYFY